MRLVGQEGKGKINMGQGKLGFLWRKEINMIWALGGLRIRDRTKGKPGKKGWEKGNGLTGMWDTCRGVG